MSTRALVLALLLAPLFLFGGLHLVRTAGTERLMPAFDTADVARLEIARGREQVVLARRKDTGQWEILSAANAPGDRARIEAVLHRLKGLKGKPLPETTPAQRREPLELRLSDATGEVLGHAAFWTGEASARPQGPRLAIADTPALPLWPSAWSALEPPRIPPAEVAAAALLTPAGPSPLPVEATAEVAKLLGALSARDFVAGTSVNWAGARLVRVTMADGSLIDLQQVPDGEGRFHLRLTSDSRTDVRAARQFAFRVGQSLP